jgi:transglutaminase-like putative cysteine protease
MRLSITHETRYDYAPPVDVAQHIACLQPLQTASQRLLAHALQITPTPSQRKSAPDVFGNLRTFISLQIPHSELILVAQSTVETQMQVLPDHDQPWELAHAHLRYRVDGTYDPDVEFVFSSPHVPRHTEFADYARSSFAPDVGVHAGALDLMHRIHADFTYDSHSTDVHTPALEALRLRKGVCQDFAHIMIACLRSLGLAARYVSGYLLTEPPPGQPRLIGNDASHAWVSVLLPTMPGQLRWCDFDPTNDRWGWGAPGEDYVVLAVGRDYADVSPIRGVIHGGASHELTVAVTVMPLDPPTATLSGMAQSQSQSQTESQTQTKSP